MSRGSGVIVVAAALLAGCSGIGDGNGLESLSLVPFSGAQEDGSMKVFECVRNRVNAFGTFTDNTIGDYTTRVRWTSSNPEVVRISNGDEPVPGSDTEVFINGTLTPVAPGTARITADYVGLSKSIDVTVESPDSLAIVPANPPLAPGSLLALRVRASLEGTEFDVTSGVTWEFAEPDDDVAEIDDGTGIVTGVGEGGPLTAEASFIGACDTVLSTQVRVVPIQRLEIRREFDPPLTELIVGTSELLKAIAHFDVDGDGQEDATQDLSTQAIFASTNTQAAAFSTVPGVTNDLLALAAGTGIGIGARFAPDDDDDDDNGSPYEPVDAEPFLLSTVAATLNAISIAPLTPTIEKLGTVQFKATGSYDNGARTQDITRHVLWTSSNISQVTISNQVPSAGLATSVRNEDATVTITATNNAATTTKTVNTTLKVGDGDPDDDE